MTFKIARIHGPPPTPMLPPIGRPLVRLNYFQITLFKGALKQEGSPCEVSIGKDAFKAVQPRTHGQGLGFRV